MTEPLRLRDGAGPARVLMAGSRLAVPSASRRKALAFTSAAASMAASGTAVAAGGATSLVKSVVLCVCLGTVGGGALSLAVSELVRQVDSSRAHPTGVGTPKPSRLVRPPPSTAVPARLSEDAQARPSSAAELVLPEARSGPHAAAAADVAMPAVPSSPSPARKLEPAPSLFEEQRAIETARAAVARGDATTALGLLDDYQRSYARGQFRPEALALRIEALSQRGELGRARSLAAEFRHVYPHHPLLLRVQAAVQR